MPKGIRVAKTGRDATRGGVKDLAFTSENQSLKISPQFRDKVSEVTVNGATTLTLIINHDLLYKPVFRLFVEAVAGSGIWYGDSNSLDTLDGSTALVWTVKDITPVSITILFVTQGPCTIRYKYWLFQDSLDDV